MAKVSSPLSSTVAISRHRLGDDGVIPNNAALPLVVYSAVFDLPSTDPIFGKDGPLLEIWG